MSNDEVKEAEMSEAINIKSLADAIADRLKLPIEDRLWDAGDCAEYFGISKESFLRRKSKLPAFPKAHAPGHPRWFAGEVIGWRKEKSVELPPDDDIPEDAHHLYRQYDSVGTLLYAGISLSSLSRLAEHKHKSKWFYRIARIEMEPFKTRRAALEAEKRAIIEERPLFNVVHNHRRVRQ